MDPNDAQPASRALAVRWIGPRRIWLGAAAFHGLVCAVALAGVILVTLPSETERLLRSAAQFGLVHSMAAIGCLTLANAGAVRLGAAPILFVGGSMILSAALAVGLIWPFEWRDVAWSGAALCVAGWIVVLRGIADIPTEERGGGVHHANEDANP